MLSGAEIAELKALSTIHADKILQIHLSGNFSVIRN